MSDKPIIGKNQPRDVKLFTGQQWDCCCARCGGSVDRETCDYCGGEGVDGHDCGEDCCMCLRPEDNVTCDICQGEGGWLLCMSSPEWCESNPLPGREEIKRGQFEWYLVNNED